MKWEHGKFPAVEFRNRSSVVTAESHLVDRRGEVDPNIWTTSALGLDRKSDAF
jgi:hypothetical protein